MGLRLDLCCSLPGSKSPTPQMKLIILYELKELKCSLHTLQTIAECTAPMDPNTWNAYHIVSNRARSVCYATRQNQFRRRTEMAVNKLALATQEQISTMDKLKEDQETMQEAALASLDSVKTQQEELFHQHKHLKNAHRLLKTNIITNMDQLAKEKSIIAQSQDQLVEMTESVLEKLGNVCVPHLCTCTVYLICVHVLCTSSVYVYCVPHLCTCTVYLICVRVLCTSSVYVYCVPHLCTCTVYLICVRVLCTSSVYLYCVPHRCT